MIQKKYDAFGSILDKSRTMKYVQILQCLSQHYNIVRLRNIKISENEKDIYMMYEYVEYNLKEVKHVLTECQKIYVIYQCLRAIKYIHMAGFIHLNLKPTCILIDSECQVKISGFENAK